MITKKDMNDIIDYLETFVYGVESRHWEYYNKHKIPINWVIEDDRWKKIKKRMLDGRWKQELEDLKELEKGMI